MRIVKRKHVIESLCVLAAMTVGGCQADLLPEAEVSTEAAGTIEIKGGSPSGLGLGSRGVSEPEKEGYCNADKLTMWFYRGMGARDLLISYPPSLDKITEYAGAETADVNRYSPDSPRDKIATHRFTAQNYTNHTVGYVIPALAYTNEDMGKRFLVEDINKIEDVNGVNKESGYKGMRLTLTGNQTPELYFGHLTFEYNNGSKKSEVRDEIMTTLPHESKALSDETVACEGCVLTGKLYRIVSQLNVKVSGIDSRTVRRLEMYLSDVPASVRLYGEHGVWYPVGPTGDVVADNGLTPVAVTEDFSDNTAVLSTFLLPSLRGRSLRIRVYYSERFKDEEGKEREPEDFEISPSKSVFLTGDDAEVYRSAAPEYLKHGEKGKEDLYVYDATDDLFYSYSNVRVNVSGTYEKIFTEKSEAEVHIEVCPSFEDSHYFEIE